MFINYHVASKKKIIINKQNSNVMEFIITYAHIFVGEMHC